MKNKIIWGGVLGAALLFSLFVAAFVLQYGILNLHDYFIPHVRHFADPQRGRFLASFLNALFVVNIPGFFGLHPNDANIMITRYAKAFFIILITLIYTQSAFLFSKKKFDCLNPTFVVLYLFLFLSVFNQNYIFTGLREFFCTEENTVFWEYPASLLQYTLFWSIFGYFFVNDKLMTKGIYILTIILVLLIGTSIEIVNFPTVYSLTIFGILYLFNKNKNNAYVKQACGTAVTYAAALVFLWFNEQRDLHCSHFNLAYIREQFGMFCSQFWHNFLCKESLLLIPVILLTAVIFVFFKNKGNTRRFVLFVTVNIVMLIIFYFSTFFLAGNDGNEPGNFPIYYLKMLSVYKMTCLYWLVLTFGYLSFIMFKDENKSKGLLLITTVILTLIFSQSLIFRYPQKIIDARNVMKQRRLTMYKTEKMILIDFPKYTGEANCAEIPDKFQEDILSVISVLPWYFAHLQEIHGDEYFRTSCIEFVRDKDETQYNFSEEELNNIKFSNLNNEFFEKRTYYLSKRQKSANLTEEQNKQ